MAQSKCPETSTGTTASKPRLPDGWIVRLSKSHPDRVYYFNTVTGASTWLLPELKQSSERRKKSKSCCSVFDVFQSSERRKKSKSKHHHRKRDQQKHTNQGHELQQNQQPSENVADEFDDDDDDDDYDYELDLTCENDAELDFVSSAVTEAGVHVHQQSVTNCEKTDRQTAADGQKKKKKWKKLWDSSSGLRPQVNSSSPEEDCSLTAEQLQIIQFPKFSHAKGIGTDSGVTNQRSKAQGNYTASSNHLQTSTDEKMGNRLSYFDSGKNRVQAPLSPVQSHRHAVKEGPNFSVTSQDLAVPGLVAVEYRSGVKSGSVLKPAPRLPRNQTMNVAGKRQKTVASSDSVVELGNNINDSGPKITSLKQGKILSQSLKQGKNASQSDSNVPFVPRVLTTAKSDDICTVSRSTRNAYSSINDSNIIPDVKRRKKVPHVAAHMAGNKTVDITEPAAKNPKIARKGKSLQTGEVGVGNTSPVSAEAYPTKPPVSPSRSPLNREQENWAVSATAEVSGTQRQEGQAQRPILKARRKRKRENATSPLNRSEEVAPQASALTSVLVSGEQATEALSSAPLPTPYSGDGAQAAKESGLDPGLSAFTPVQLQSCCSSGQPLSGHPEVCYHSPHSPQSPEKRELVTPTGVVELATAAGAVSQSSLMLNPSSSVFPITPVFASYPEASARVGMLREGEDTMDVDDDYDFDNRDSDDDQIMLDLQELRQKFQPDVKAKAVGVLTESVQKTQASRSVSPESAPEADSQVVYIVVDTNVWIKDLSFIQTLRDMSLKDLGYPHLIIPWVVLQELDGLKMSHSQSKKAQDAVRFIHSCLTSRHPRVRGQTPAQAEIRTNQLKAFTSDSVLLKCPHGTEAVEPVDDLEIHCSDDRILQCCLQCQKKYGQNSVILLTNDLNLENKAVVMAIKCFDSKRLWPLLDGIIVEDDHPPLASRNVANAPQDGALDEGQQQGYTGRITPASPVSVISNTPGRRKRRRKSKSNSGNPFSQQQEQQRKMVDELLCEAKGVVVSVLSGVVEKEMKAVFDDMWLEMLIRKPPWSAHDLVVILQKHWLAVFSMKLDRSLKVTIDFLVKEFSPHHGVKLELQSAQVCLHNCLWLVVGVNQFSPCAEGVKRLRNLVEKTKALALDAGKEETGTSPPASQPCSFQNSTGKRGSTPTSFAALCNNEAVNRPVPTTTSSSSSTTAAAASAPTATSSSSTSVNPNRKSTAMEKNQNVKKPRSVSGPPSQTLQKKSSQGRQGASPLLRQVKPQVGVKQVKPQVPQSNTAEENAAIEQVFQGIWSVIFNCCDNVEKMMGSSAGVTDPQSVKGTLLCLVPHVVQIQEAFTTCLSFSPCILERQMDSFAAFCSHLNSFFNNANIPATSLPAVAPGNMIVFMRETKNRILLRTGLDQLSDLIGRLQKAILWMSSVS